MTRVTLLLCVAALTAAVFGCATTKTGTPDPALLNRARVEVALQLADEHIDEGRFDRARAALAAYTTSTDERLALTLARIDVEEGRYTDAVQQLEQIPPEARHSLPYHEVSAVACEGLGRWSAAADAYECAYHADPTAARLAAWLETLVPAGRAADARVALEAERAQFPGDPAVQDVAARLYEHLGDPDAAINELTAAVLRDPQSIAVRRRLAEVYVVAGRHAEAMSVWHELVGSTADPQQRQDFRLRRAECLLALGEYAEAERVYRVLTLTQPDDARAYIGLATAALADVRPAEALAAGRRAVELAPENPEARLALACAHARLGQYAEAIDMLAASPGASTDAHVRKYIAHLQAAAAAQHD